MITGHIALSYFAGGRLRERRLLWLVGAGLAPDIVDVGLALADVCSPYGLYSHTIPALAIEAVLAAAICWIMTRDRRVAAAAIALVLVHLPLDFVTGTKAFWPYAPLVGMDLYRFPVADLAIELPMVILGWMYARRELANARFWLTKPTIVALVALQCFLNVSKYMSIQAPVTSQSNSCRATYQVH